MSSMRHIKQYQIFESSASAPALTAVQINWLDKCADEWKLNPQTGLVDVDGDFYCRRLGLTDLKGVKFGKVSGDFYCYGNQLTTLEGAPKTVGGGFNCGDNELTTLEGAPQVVGGGFYCSDNVLTTLEGAPQTVDGTFSCEGNPVSKTTLKAIFELMEKGKPYQQALEQRWPKMKDVDRVLMYKQIPDLSPEDIRKYQALATYNNIKGYL